VTAEPSAEPVEGAVEPPSEATPREAAPETPSPETAPPETAPPETAPPETAAPETAPEPAPEEPKAVAVPAPEPTPPPPEVTPPPAPMPPPPPETGFPWGLALGTLAVLAALGGLGAALWRTRAAPELEAPFRPRPKPTPTGVDEISVDELRGAADATTVLEQRLDEEVRARLALEERLTQAGEELKVLRDRLHRVERRREEAH
jgi:hypothetical protein